MNRLLRSLLPEVPPEADPRLRRRWSSYLLFGNSGTVPLIDLPAGRFLWNRGFLVLLLDSRGRPTHICKVRPEGEDGTSHEGRILPRLSANPQLRDSVPPALWNRIPGMQVTMMAFMPGQAYTTLIKSRSPARWAEDMREVLDIATRVVAVGHTSYPDLQPHSAPLDLHVDAEPALAQVDRFGISRAHREALATGMRGGGTVPPVLQHGDLWPANLLLHRRSWCLLDFELFGTERVPLFDVLHLLRTCMTARAAGRPGYCWLDHLRGDDADAITARAILSDLAVRAGLDGHQAAGCLLHYLVTFALRCARLHLPDPFMEPILREVRRAAELALDGEGTLRALFRPSAARGVNPPAAPRPAGHAIDPRPLEPRHADRRPDQPDTRRRGTPPRR